MRDSAFPYKSTHCLKFLPLSSYSSHLRRYTLVFVHSISPPPFTQIPLIMAFKAFHSLALLGLGFVLSALLGALLLTCFSVQTSSRPSLSMDTVAPL